MHSRNLKITNEIIRLKLQKKGVIIPYAGTVFIGGFIIYYIISCMPNNFFECFTFIPYVTFLLALLAYSISKIPNQNEYLSEIAICDDTINLEYSIKNKKTRTAIINKNNIEKFIFNADIFYDYGRQDLMKGLDYPEINGDITIILKDGENIQLNKVIDTHSVSFVLEMIIAFFKIPNFEPNITCNSKGVQTEIDYVLKFGKKPPFKIRVISFMPTILYYLCLQQVNFF